MKTQVNNKNKIKFNNHNSEFIYVFQGAIIIIITEHHIELIKLLKLNLW